MRSHLGEGAGRGDRESGKGMKYSSASQRFQTWGCIGAPAVRCTSGAGTAVRVAARVHKKELIAGPPRIVRPTSAYTDQSSGSRALSWHCPILCIACVRFCSSPWRFPSLFVGVDTADVSTPSGHSASKLTTLPVCQFSPPSPSDVAATPHSAPKHAAQLPPNPQSIPPSPPPH